ncbi:MAG: hypothetical protein ACP6IY_20015 [Promethearchaeia archaeon]
MPTYEELLGVSNALFYILYKTGEHFGLNADLIFNVMAIIIKDDPKLLKAFSDIDINGTDLKTIADNFATKMMNMGYCENVAINEASDNQVIVEISDSIFLRSVKHFVGNNGGGDTLIPDPLIIILYAIINMNTGRVGNITGSKYFPDKNMISYTVTLEEL